MWKANGWFALHETFDDISYLYLYRNGQVAWIQTFKNHFAFLSLYCWIVPLAHWRHIFFINIMFGTINGDVINIASLSTWQYIPTHRTNASKFPLRYDIIIRKYKKCYDYITKRTGKSNLFLNRGYNQYLCVYPSALRLYHHSALLCNPHLRFILCRSASEWYNLNTHGGR